MGGGDFSAEAYQQLRDAYDREQQRQVDDELKGTQLMGQEYGLETVPVDSPWADKIEKWEYPSGRGQHMDERQSPDEILQIMRDSAQERIDARMEDEDDVETDDEDNESLDEDDGIVTNDIALMSEEEFDAYLTSLLEGEEDDESEHELDGTDEPDDEGTDEETEDERDASGEDGTEDEEPGNEEGDEEVVPDPVEDEDEYDPDDVAAQIAELRAELENLQFVPDEPETDDESE